MLYYWESKAHVLLMLQSHVVGKYLSQPQSSLQLATPEDPHSRCIEPHSRQTLTAVLLNAFTSSCVNESLFTSIKLYFSPQIIWLWKPNWSLSENLPSVLQLTPGSSPTSWNIWGFPGTGAQVCTRKEEKGEASVTVDQPCAALSNLKQRGQHTAAILWLSNVILFYWRVQ